MPNSTPTPGELTILRWLAEQPSKEAPISFMPEVDWRHCRSAEDKRWIRSVKGRGGFLNWKITKAGLALLAKLGGTP